MRRPAALVVLACALVGAAPAPAAPVSGWLSFGNDPSRSGFTEHALANPAAPVELWSARLEGRVVGQPIIVRDVPEPGRKTVYLGTSHGLFYAYDDNGFERAHVQLGRMTLEGCDWLPDGEYGITGTPVVDPATATLYVADARGQLHALDLVSLAQRDGWPIRLYRDFEQRLVWGASTIVGQTLYVPTGGLCGRASGKLFAVDLRSREVSSWQAVPQRLGGGGGIWGWGGPVYDRRTDSLLVATGNALPYGQNTGKKFNEAAGYAVHLVRLSLDLDVLAANAPVSYREPLDLDMTGSPIVVRAAGCPVLVAAENKNGVLYTWRLAAIDEGVVQSVRLGDALNGQPAWSPRTRSLYVVGHDRLHRLRLTKRCELRPVWTVPLGVDSVNGAPTVAGDVVWFPVSDGLAIWGVDARSGDVLARLSMGSNVYGAPAVLDGRLYAGSFTGIVKVFG